MQALSADNFGMVCGGLSSDSDVKMKSEGASVWTNVACPDNKCPGVEVSGPANYNSLSPSGWDNLIGAAGGTAIGYAATEFTTGFAIGLGLAAAPVAVVGAVVVGAAALGVALQYGLAYAQQPSVSYSLGRFASGYVTGEP